MAEAGVPTTEREIAETALRHIRSDNGSFYTSSDFDQLYAQVSLAQAVGNLAWPPYRHVISVVELHGNLLTILLKLSWLNARREDGLDDTSWMFFAASDIVAFHVFLRCLFDEVAGMVREMATKPGVVPESFHDIQRWLGKRVANRGVLGEELADAITSCDWFEDVRELRDDLLHRGARTIVFPERGRILFQVHVGTNRRVLVPPAMFNENIADFAPYSALVMAKLGLFLDQVARVLLGTVESLRVTGPAAIHHGHPGLGVLADWLRALVRTLDEADV